VAVVVTTLVSWATGYEKNVNVTIEDIKAREVVAGIHEFNSLIDRNDDLSKKRIALARDKERIVKQFGKKSIRALESTAAVEMAGLEMEELAEEITVIRTRLRAHRFTEDASGGAPVFRIKSDTAKRGRVWRLKAGVKPLDENKLLMIGGGTVMGDIPGGVPKPAVPGFDLAAMLRLLPIAMIIAVLGFMETIGVAKAMAARTGRMVEPDQELISQGMANMAGAFGQSYTVSGSFSRTAVNFQAGAVTGFSNVASSLVVLVVMLFLTKYLYHLPQAVLAAIIMMAVASLIKIEGFVHAHKARLHDGIIGVITFIATLAFAPHLDKGIIIGVALSLAYRLLKEMHPDIHFLAKHPDGSFKPADIYNLKPCRHIAVIRFNDSLFFENVSFLEHTIIEVIALMPELKHIIIAGKGINEIDASGEELLSTLVPRLRKNGLEISFSGLNEESTAVLKNTGLYEEIGANRFFLNVQAAVDAIHERIHKGSDETQCPLITPLPADEHDHHVTHFGHKRKQVKFWKKEVKEDSVSE
jgi:anti-anti-sigma regulatory factor/multisubunit Na+/H+ antiporter MnhF subunit